MNHTKSAEYGSISKAKPSYQRTDSSMTQKLMISYSRSQTPFVNSFYQELAEAGYSIWLDYRSIVPARPWLDQIQEGIAWADTVLLVVSKESIASSHVKLEWEHALQEKKRVILVI